jgi:hypothetical protein
MFQSLTYSDFIHIGGSRVDKTISNFNGIDDTPSTFLRIWNLKHAEPNNGHCDAVIQCHGLHGLFLMLVGWLVGWLVGGALSAGSIRDIPANEKLCNALYV